MVLNVNSNKRVAERYSRSENIVVKAKIGENDFWKVKAKLKSISRLGAGFDIENPCKIGQLVSLLLSMPVNLRAYDHDKELYRVWGLVQHCNAVNSDEFTGYQVGVAFVGKEAPESFYNNHDQSYRITGLNEDGLWLITEAEREFINRRHHRFWISLDSTLTVNESEEQPFLLKAVTENISKSGVAVFCESDANVGDHVIFACPEFEFVTPAIVRNRRGVGNTTPKIHLEFVGEEFPIEKIELEVEQKV